MTESKKNTNKIWQRGIGLKENVHQIISRLRQLQGNPNHIAMGMGIGVFVCVTPTFPFQTFLAIALAFILRGSKASAVIGSWLAAPAIPFFYIGSYKLGTFILGYSIPIDMDSISISKLADMGWSVALAMLTGGTIIGLLPGAAGYLITYHAFKKIRSKTSAPEKT